MKNLETMVDRLYEKHGVGFVESIVVYAKEYFADCLQDFCIQHVSYECIIFGGTNRLKWSVRKGFTVLEKYCTPSFIEHAKKVEIS